MLFNKASVHGTGLLKFIGGVLSWFSLLGDSWAKCAVSAGPCVRQKGVTVTRALSRDKCFIFGPTLDFLYAFE